MNYYTKHFFFAILLILSACGFHMRGNVWFPEDFKTLEITSGFDNDEITTRISNILENRGVKVIASESITENTYNLSIEQHSFTEQTTAYSANNIPSQMSITISVPFSITSPDNKVLLRSSVSKTSQLNISPDNPVIQDGERLLAQKDLRSKAAYQIVNMLSNAITKMQETQ